MKSRHIETQTKERLKAKFETLNPFDIQSKMFVKIKKIMKLVNEKKQYENITQK